MNVIAVFRAQRLIHRLEQAGAYSEASAIRVPAWPAERDRYRALLETGGLIETGDSHVYLVPDIARATIRKARLKSLIFLLAAAILWSCYMFLMPVILR